MARGTSFPKSDFRHWEGRIYKSKYLADDGTKREAKHYTVRLSLRGRRDSIALGLASKREAAKKACELYKAILADGWDAALVRFSTAKEGAPPEMPAEPKAATVGEYIAAASTVAEVSPRSLHDYCAMLRRVAGAVAGVKEDPSRFGPKKGGASKWRAKTDAIPLDALTKDAVEEWRLAYPKGAKDPQSRRRAERTANSVLRQAKALFSPKIAAHVAKTLTLPAPLPFAGVGQFKKHSARYSSQIDPAALLEAARRDLGGNPENAEQWKAFILALFCGLRRSEIDTLTWSQINFHKGVVSIHETRHFSPKSEDSVGEIDLDPEAARILQSMRPKKGTGFVLEGDDEAKPQSAISHYRAGRHLDKLTDWLRAQGISALKPLHELRKEAGSLVAKKHGLYGAQRFLRHASPATTADHYLDKKERVTPGLGSLLATTDKAETD